MQRRHSLFLAPVLGVILAACGTASSPPDGETVAPATVPPTTGPAIGAASPAAVSEVAASPAAALEPWQTVALRDVRSGETFAVADLAGKLVVIEPMAIWCSNCERQQQAASKALAALESDQVVYISLDVDPGEAESDLAAYADERGFDWRFVVAGREMSRALAEAFGDQVLSPPSTPKVIVTPAGEIIGPQFGIADAEAVEQELLSHLG
jgi:thiol-disulfide isomerase/thioredoxin